MCGVASKSQPYAALATLSLLRSAFGLCVSSSRRHNHEIDKMFRSSISSYHVAAQTGSFEGSFDRFASASNGNNPYKWRRNMR